MHPYFSSNFNLVHTNNNFKSICYIPVICNSNNAHIFHQYMFGILYIYLISKKVLRLSRISLFQFGAENASKYIICLDIL